MKTLLTLFILLFSSSVLADDISDFQIEGISVGDSLLDYFTLEEIVNNAETRNFNDNSFYEIEINSSKYKDYQSMSFNLKSNDKNYIIYGVIGTIFYRYDPKKCIYKKKEIEKEINFISQNAERIDHGTYAHWYDKTNKSKVTQVEFYFDKRKGSIVISCYDWSKKITNELGWTDNLSVEIYLEEFANFLREQS